MHNSSSSDTEPESQTKRRTLLRQVSAMSLFSITGVATSKGVVAQSGNSSDSDTGGNSTDENTDENSTDETTGSDSDSEETTSGSDDDSETVCEGSPTMSRTSVTSPNNQITTDDPAVVEANFRPDPTIPDDCTIIVDLEFSFTDAGFQWGGGADWDQATSDLVVGTFEVSPGEIRDIRAELHTQGAEAGDKVTVVADYELWFEGNQENSVQQSGIRHTISVESPNPPEEEDDNIIDFSPGFGAGTAIAGFGGASYLLKRRLTGDESESE